MQKTKITSCLHQDDTSLTVLRYPKGNRHLREGNSKMDSGSHVLFGVTLAGLAFFLPEVVSDPQLAAAVLSVTIVGSSAPDFDSVLRIKSQDAYLKNHRGWSHSLPAWPLWSMIIG